MVERNKRRKTLLVVCDSTLFIYLEVAFLSSKGYNISVARSGRQAIEKAESICPDLILMDQIMPDLNGDKICRRLKNNPRTSRVPVIIISSFGRDEVRDKCLSSGCQAFVKRPLRWNVLLAIVREQMKTVQRRQVRIDTNIRCTVHTDTKKQRARILNLNTLGAFLKVAPPPAPGRLVEMAFNLPGVDDEIKVDASVIWSGKLKERNAIGAGVEFLNLPSVSAEHIRRQIGIGSATRPPEEMSA